MRQDYSVLLWLSWNSLCRSDCPHIYSCSCLSLPSPWIAKYPYDWCKSYFLIFWVTFIFMYTVKLCVHAKFSWSICLPSNTMADSICWVFFIVQHNSGFIVSLSCVQDFVLFNLCLQCSKNFKHNWVFISLAPLSF